TQARRRGLELGELMGVRSMTPAMSRRDGSGRPPRLATWRRVRHALGTVAVACILGAPLPASAKTLRTITVDGNLDDWTEVLLDGAQTVADRSLAEGDPDAPSQSQRDERGVAVTWDATKLYFFFSRTGAGTNSVNFVFYLDVGHDGFLS